MPVISIVTSVHDAKECLLACIQSKLNQTFTDFELILVDIGVATVAAEAGHAQPSTTLAIYTQVYQKRQDSIRSQMSKTLYGPACRPDDPEK